MSIGRTLGHVFPSLYMLLFVLPQAWPQENITDISALLMDLLIQQRLDTIATENKMGIWVSFRAGNRTMEGSSAFGYSSVETPTPAAVGDIVPAGSITKTFTATAILRLVEAGALSLDDPITARANDFFGKMLGSNKTLEDLYGPPVSNLTLRMLLSMQGGQSDYNNSLVKEMGIEHPLHDITPQDYLSNSTIVNYSVWRCQSTNSSCDPPRYNSMGFLLLGLALGQQLGLSRWEAVDQLTAAIPPELAEAYEKLGVLFFKHGPCSEYPRVAHFYDLINGEYVDQYHTSCLNGWAFGNIGISARAATAFYGDLLGSSPLILNRETVLQMQQWGEILAGHEWERYGLGLMWLPMQQYAHFDATVPGAEPFLYASGHAGADYGSYAHSGYHPALDASYAIIMNKANGLLLDGQPIKSDHIFCRAYRAIFQLSGHGTIGDAALKCDTVPPGPRAKPTGYTGGVAKYRYR